MPRGANRAGRLHCLLPPIPRIVSTMSRDHDNRSSLYDGQDDEPQDRRGSCRYPVADVPAVLGWWETPEARAERATSIVETENPSGSAQRPKLFDAETYSAIMARGPALRGGFHATASSRPPASPHHQNGRAAVPALSNGKASTAPAPKP